MLAAKYKLTIYYLRNTDKKSLKIYHVTQNKQQTIKFDIFVSLLVRFLVENNSKNIENLAKYCVLLYFFS